MLFRNAYRIRDDDLFDLSFATQSEYFQNILKELEAYKSSHPEIAEDDDIFDYLHEKVRGRCDRPSYDLGDCSQIKVPQYIADDHILLFESHEEATYGNKFKTHLLNLLMGRLADSQKTLWCSILPIISRSLKDPLNTQGQRSP